MTITDDWVLNFKNSCCSLQMQGPVDSHMFIVIDKEDGKVGGRGVKGKRG